MAKAQTSPTDKHKPKPSAKKAHPAKAKPPSKKTASWVAFVLSNNEVNLIKGVRKARLYEEDVGEMIEEKREFILKSDATEWVKLKEGAMKDAEPMMSETTEEAKSPVLNIGDQAKLDAVLREIDAKRPSDKVEIHYRTSAYSKAVSAIIRFYTIQGRDVWNVKPDGASLAMANFGKVFKQENKHVEQAILNMSYGRMRDLSGDPNKVATKSWTSPTTQSERSFDTYVCMTHFMLPDLDDLPTPDSEDAWIVNTCQALGNAIIYILKQDTFARCYQHALKNERIWNAVTGKSGKGEGKSYVDFAKSAKVSVVKCPNFNTHVVKADAAKLVTHLYTNRYAAPKYPEPSISDSESEEDDDDEEGKDTEEGKESDSMHTPPNNRRISARKQEKEMKKQKELEAKALLEAEHAEQQMLGDIDNDESDENDEKDNNDIDTDNDEENEKEQADGH